MDREIPELKPIKDITTGIAFRAIVETNKECRAVRKRMAKNLKLSWEKYREAEAQVLKIVNENSQSKMKGFLSKEAGKLAGGVP